ncbi:hypothetical protein TSUD_30770 [Trifolium subterraneum]|uniref:C2H2-type domain-containing protein n=1 Tax=Trifolium subterraneum TaxID=3900 RepID=A0A2Z6M6M0_TRISU|nr:hypothetical protein TSUD_30770 [Trifolium subterraneum]
MANNNHSNNILACRLCSQVFTNIQSLLTHIESHMLEENLALLMLNNINNPHFQTQIEQIPNPLQAPPLQPLPLAIPQPRTSQIMNNVFSHPPHILQNVTPSFEKNVAEMTLMSPTPPTHQDYMEVSQNDGTKPFIDKLDEPINSMHVNPPIVNDDTVDLELKL